MKRLELTSVEIRTLRDMGIFHKTSTDPDARPSNCAVKPGINPAAGRQRVRRALEGISKNLGESDLMWAPRT